VTGASAEAHAHSAQKNKSGRGHHKICEHLYWNRMFLYISGAVCKSSHCLIQQRFRYQVFIWTR